MLHSWAKHPKTIRIIFGLILVGFFAWANGWRAAQPWVAHLDQKIYDLRLTQTPAQLDERIVIVDVDEKSLAEQGRWPWPRSNIASLIDQLAGAKVIAFDVVFADRVQDEKSSQGIERALRSAPVVLGYYFSSEPVPRQSGVLPQAFGPSVLAPGAQVTHWTGYGANLPQLGRAAKAQGFFNPIPDSDGVVRSLPLLAEYQGSLYESLALTTLKLYLNVDRMVLRPDELILLSHSSQFNLRTQLALSKGLSLMVPFRKGQGPNGGNFRYYSASDVLAGKVAGQSFDGKIVLVGSSAPGLTDLRATPLSETYPGVEVHASAIRGALNQVLKVRSDFSQALGLIVLITSGALLAGLLAFRGGLGILGLGTLAMLTHWSSVSLAFSNADLVMPAAASLSMTLSLCLGNLVLGYFTEGRKRAQIVDLFGEYLSPEVVNRLASDPSQSRQQISQTREITVLFCDIRGFTKISETMDPQILSEYLNEYLTGMTEIIHQTTGTVDKYIGDAVMAFWGAPLDDSAHAAHAVDAAIKMQFAADRLSKSFVARGLPALSIGIGLHTGRARVGDMGSKLRRVYTAIGDTVNLASRLESLTKTFETSVLVSEATKQAAPTMDFVELDSVLVQGRSEQVVIYAPSTTYYANLANTRERGPVQLSLVA
jgi:adenylate cyclase